MECFIWLIIEAIILIIGITFIDIIKNNEKWDEEKRLKEKKELIKARETRMGRKNLFG